MNNKKPLSLCKECHERIHSVKDDKIYKHIHQNTIDDFWKCKKEVQVYLSDCIVKY